MIKYLYIYSIKFNTLPASCMTHMSNKRLSVLNEKPDHRILIVLNSQYCRPGSGYLRIQNFFFFRNRIQGKPQKRCGYPRLLFCLSFCILYPSFLIRVKLFYIHISSLGILIFILPFSILVDPKCYVLHFFNIFF